MLKFQDWRADQNIDDYIEQKVSQDEFVRVCLEYFGATIRGEMKTYQEYRQENLIESVETSRYSIEVNYRTTSKEALESFAKISLGYISAAMKNYGYHTRHVFTEKPLRLMVSSRNWDNGEWCGLISWNPDHACFILSKGFYNKDRRSVSIQNSKKCDGDSAAEISKELHNTMHNLKDKADKSMPALKPVALKRGPKG